METILEHRGCTYSFEHVAAAAEYRVLPESQAYACLVWDATGALGAADRDRLAEAIIASNCRYVVCGGANCEAWHDAMDQAFLAQGLEGEAYEEHFVMTTWHTAESEREVAFYFVHCAHAESGPYSRYHVLQVAGGSDVAQRLREAVRDEATDVGEDDKPASE